MKATGRSASPAATAAVAAAAAAAAVVGLTPRVRGVLAGLHVCALGAEATRGDGLRATAATAADARVAAPLLTAALGALATPGGAPGVGGGYPRTPLDAAVVAAWAADVLVAKAVVVVAPAASPSPASSVSAVVGVGSGSRSGRVESPLQAKPSPGR